MGGGPGERRLHTDSIEGLGGKKKGEEKKGGPIRPYSHEGKKKGVQMSYDIVDEEIRSLIIWVGEGGGVLLVEDEAIELEKGIAKGKEIPLLSFCEESPTKSGEKGKV